MPTHMLKRFEGKAALVTGASSGIGKAIAFRLAEEGAALVCVSNAPEELAAAVAEIKTATGAKAVAVIGDVSLEADCEHAVQAALDEFGRLDVAVNNAGIGRFSKLVDVLEETLDALLGVHVKGTAFGLKYQIPAIARSGGGGCILVMSSVGGTFVNPSMAAAGIGPYAASKAAVEMLVKYAAVEAAEHGTRVNAIAPGAVQTNIIPGPGLSSMGALSAEEFNERTGGMHLLGRGAQAQEVAALAAFLASEEASFITGSVVPIDGGFKLQSTPPVAA